MKNSSTFLKTILLGSLLLTSVQVLAADLVVDPGTGYVNNDIYYNAPPDQILNQGYFENDGAVHNSSWITNRGRFDNNDLLSNYGTGTVLFNDTGGTFNNGNAWGLLTQLSNSAQITNTDGATFNNYSRILQYGNFTNTGIFTNYSIFGGLGGGDIEIFNGGGIGNNGHGIITNNFDMTVRSGASIVNGGTGTMINNGRLQSEGELWNHENASFSNNGELSSDFYMDSYGTFVNQNAAMLDNTGTLWNHGTFTNDASITNSGVHAYLSNASGSEMNNTGDINSDDQATLRNHGVLNNSGNITNDGVAENTGEFNISGTPLLGIGSYEQTAGKTVVNGTLAASNIDILGGLLGGSGTIQGDLYVGAGAEVNPGNSPGTLEIDGGFFLDIDALLTLEVKGTGVDEFDRLILMSGDYDLLGDIEFSLLDNYLLDDFLANFNLGDFFRYGDRTTNFPAIIPSLFADAHFSVLDGNNNSTELWLLSDNTLGTTAPLPATVPEPTTLTLIGLCLAGLGYRRKLALPAMERTKTGSLQYA